MRAVAWAGRILCAVAVFGGALPARAQDLPATTVLGMATEGADDTLVAENLTAVLRRAVEEDRTVRHTGREATLAQMSLAFGCEDQRDAQCLQQIGQELQSRFLISGTVSRTTRGGDWAFRVEAWIFDVQAGRELRTASAQFGRSRADIDDLRDVARTLVGRLLAGDVGGLDVQAEEEGAEVVVDGEVAGEIADGHLLVRNVEAGEHAIEVRAEGFEPFETTATVRAGATARVRARLVEVGETGGDRHRRHRGGGIGPLQWVGIGSLVAGAVMGVIAIAMAADVNATDNSAPWIEYRHQVSVFAPEATSACDASGQIRGREFNGRFERGDDGEWELGRDDQGNTRVPQGRTITPEELASPDADFFPYQGNQGATLDQGMIETVCSERTMQWILGGVAVAAGVVGTYLVFGTGGSSDDEADGDADGARLQLAPILSSEQRGLGLRLTF